MTPRHGVYRKCLGDVGVPWTWVQGNCLRDIGDTRTWPGGESLGDMGVPWKCVRTACLGDMDVSWSYPQAVGLGDIHNTQTWSAGKCLGDIWDESGGHFGKSGGHLSYCTIFTNHYQPSHISGSRRNSRRRLWINRDPPRLPAIPHTLTPDASRNPDAF